MSDNTEQKNEENKQTSSVTGQPENSVDNNGEVEAVLKGGEPGANEPEANGAEYHEVLISHMTPSELLQISVRELMSMYTAQAYTPEEKECNQKILGKFRKYYGEDFDVETTQLEENDVRLAEVANDYLHEKLEKIKDKALSMNIATLNEAINEICRFIGFDLDLSQTEKSSLDTMYKHRVGHFPEMANTYTVLDTVRDVIDISTDSTMSLGSKIRLEKDIQVMEKLHQTQYITDEQMAIMYENVGRIHDHYFAKDKNNTAAIDKEQKIAAKYMEKALNLTSDVDRIQSCADYLKKEGKQSPKIARMIQSAYERFFSREGNNDGRNLSVAHEKYADSIVGQESMVGFIGDVQRELIHHQTNRAIDHYIEAITSSPMPENKTSVLNKLVHYLQKFGYDAKDNAFRKSINVVNDMFSGKNKVMNLVKLLPQVDENKDFKKVLLEATINELIDSKDIDASSRALLLKNTGHQWLAIADAKEDAEGIKFVQKTLKELEQQEAAKMQRELGPISRLSSSGNDYFSK